MYLVLKLSIDFLFSFFFLVILSPLLIIISFLIILESPGNPFFFHKRIGKDLRPFYLIKFRTMYVDSDKKKYWTEINDKRITKFGKLLRKYSIDELPQLINILSFKMSLIGPRPDTPFQIKNYTKEEWLNRHKILPGITGLSQTTGRSDLTNKQRKRLDLFYVNNYSFLLDLKILFNTSLEVIKGNSF
tara:strand:- start:10563 stop:11126 length:564 start_codon:yes stop_codon:yes gene_type:complete